MTKVTKLPVADPLAPPNHLSPEARLWWQQVVADYDMAPHHMGLLLRACEAWDRTNQARDEIARDGLTVPTADGSRKAHPAVAIERDSRIAYIRILRELDLCGEPSADADTAPRPPVLQQYRRK
jgi:P27 family predicted phage terminase small subunit